MLSCFMFITLLGPIQDLANVLLIGDNYKLSVRS